jgi:long-chain fatty acid transport protein
MNMKPRNAGVACGVGSLASVGQGSSFTLLGRTPAAGPAFAGTAAVADDASTIFFNPAGLARLQGVHAAAAMSGINVNTRFHDSASAAALGQALGGEGGNAGGLAMVPAAYLSVPLTDSLVLMSG